MHFLQFLTLLEDITSLVEADTIDWDPNITAAYKGAAATGINRDTSQGSRQQMQLTRPSTPNAATQSARPKEGDIAIVADQSGRMTPTLIAGISGSEVMLVNSGRQLKMKRLMAGMTKAPDAIQAQYNAKYPGKVVWSVPSNNQVDYLS